MALGLCNISEVQAGLGSSSMWTAHFEYDVMGRESLRRLLGGVESRTRYDRSGRVTDQVTKGAGYEVSHRSYEWDLSGKLRRLTAGTYTAEFDYDVVGTLAAARYDEVDILYKLPDRIGNIYPDRFGKEATYERGGRRKEDKEWTYHFDGEGFLTQRVSKTESIERYDWIHRKLLTEPLTWTYEWDGAGQLVRVKNNKKVNLRFEYDALGRRVAKINEYGKAESHRITRFLWDGNVPLHEWSYPLSERPETIDDSDGRRSSASPEPQTELTTWIFDEGTFVPSAKLVGDRRYSIISDYLGTPIEAYDEEGRRVWKRELDIYGRVRIEQGEVGLIPFLYQGQYLDTETGLAYNRFRYYSPETGAYISQDPIRLEAGLTNLYAYVHDVNAWVDPWGLNNIKTGAGRTHVTYRGTKNGLPYTVYASAPSNLGLTPDEIIVYRYGGNFDEFGGVAPKAVYSGDGVEGKQIVRGLEQRLYEGDLKATGGDTKKVANRQNPVGVKNPNRDKYLAAADEHLKTKGIH